jgi:DNA primase
MREMRFSDAMLDEIRARLPISEVIRPRVQLKKQGREWRGLSPFKQEKTPSFFVNDQKGFYHDFSSGKHGDIFTFLMEADGLSFPEAVERLASQAGVQLPKASHEDHAREQRRRTLYEVLELAAAFFETSLASQRGSRARTYLEGRGILAGTRAEFRIGYAPADRFALKEHLGKHGVTTNDMIDAGLLIAGDDIPVPYDRFRDRVIIPIHDTRGRIIAFGGRSLSDEVQPKYLNSPETALFKKGETLFNFHRARAPAHTGSLIVAVEGYLDAISLYQTGLKCVVAVLGTAITEDQIQLLWRLAPEPIICLDGDSAGAAAAERSLGRILPVLRTGVSFRFAFLRDGKDPDEVIRTQGIEKFNAVIADATPLWDMLWDSEFEKNSPIRTPDQKAMFEKRIFDLIERIGDMRVRHGYKFRARAQLVALFKTLDWEAAIAKNNAQKKRSFVRQELRFKSRNLTEEAEKTLLGILIEYPTLLELHVEKLMITELSGSLEQFKREIYRIFDDYRDCRSVLTFYKEIRDDFVQILEDVHGRLDKSGNEVMASSLYRRLPLLRWDPPVEFVDMIVIFLFDKLHLVQTERELRDMHCNPERLARDSDLERATALAQYLLEEKVRVAQRDQELAERASEIRRQVGAEAAWFPRDSKVPAVVH